MILVTGHVTAKAGAAEALRAACVAHSERSRAEEGCLDHRVHEDCERPGRFVFVEEWRDLAALRAHVATPGVARLLAAIRDHAAATSGLRVFRTEAVAL
jgi:quinol monooxygenase YgiN